MFGNIYRHNSNNKKGKEKRMKIFILQTNADMFYLEEFYYNTYQERYEKTKDISPSRIFEESEIEKAISKLVDLNMI